MARTSPVHYIAPSAISITPNANGSHRDLAVYVAKGAKIKVRCPRAGIGMDGDTSTYQEWTLSGLNRRLADTTGTQEYSIYARLPKSDYNKGYLVFAPKTGSGKDKWQYLTLDVDAIYGITSIEGATTSNSDWYVLLGEVSAVENGQRTVTLDTGILGTDQYNDVWVQSPDNLPLRIELGCTIDDEDAGPTPYVYWGQSLVLTASLVEGWTGTDIQRFDHWEITRDSGDSDADAAWNHPTGAGSYHGLTDGQIILTHARGYGDDFNGAVSATFTIVAMGQPEEGSESQDLVALKTAVINIHAETVEKYELAMTANIVGYNPMTQTYDPDSIVILIRATDQRGDVFEMTKGQIDNAGLEVRYAAVGSSGWRTLDFTGASTAVATATLDTATFFAAKQSINMRLMRIVETDDGSTAIELTQQTIAFVRDGEDSKVREWIYRLNSNAGYDATTGTANGQAVSGQTGGVDNCLLTDDFVPTGWSDDPTGVSQPGDVEWESWRDYDDENHRWGVFHTPVIHNRYAENAVIYDIVPSVSVINATADGTITTGAIAVSAYKIEGDTRSNDILPALDSVYRVKFSIDNGDWTNCTREFAAGRRSYRTYIPAASVQTTTSTISLQLLDEDENVIGIFPGITVVKDGTSITKQSETMTYAVTAASTDHPAENSNDWKSTKSAAITAYNTAHSISGSDWQQDTVMWTKTDILWSDNTHTILYTAERNPNDGTPGADGWMIAANPANVILTQNLVTTNNFTTAAVSFTAKKGSTPATITSITVHESSTFNVNQVGVTAVVVSPKSNGDSYYTEGSFTVDVNVTDPDNGDTVPFTITVPCYANLLGTWKQSIEDGVETSIAEKLSYGIFDDEVHTIEQTGEYIRGWAENTSVITKKVNNGKNLLSGVLTGGGWKSGSAVTALTTDVSVDGDDWISVGSNGQTMLRTPAFNIESGKTYKVSFTTESAAAVSLTIRRADDISTSVATWSTDSGSTLHTAGFDPSYTGSVYLVVLTSKLRHPQVEQGDAVTAFEASDIELSSRIQQTADSINLSVTNLSAATQTALNLKADSADLTTIQNGLETAGVHLSTGVIDLAAGKVNFVDPNGDAYATPKVIIDPTDGTLHAVGGYFSGEVHATSGEFSGLIKKTQTIITSSNISDYQYQSVFGPVFDFAKAGTYLVFSDLTENVDMYMYGVWGYTSNNDAARKEYVRGLVGNHVLIYNKSSRSINITGHTVLNGGEASFNIVNGQMCSMECKIRGYRYDSLYPDREGYEDIYWDCTILTID